MDVGVMPIIKPVRGGTDGAKFAVKFSAEVCESYFKNCRIGRKIASA